MSKFKQNLKTTLNMIGLEELTKYIDWDGLVKDYNLKSGDVPLDDLVELERILETYIKTNQ